MRTLLASSIVVTVLAVAAPARANDKGVVKDVTVGTNAIAKTVAGYRAKRGWNACAGLGTPDGVAILKNL